MQNRYKNGAAVLLSLLLAACCGPTIKSYAGKEPAITVQDFYKGPVEGYGFFQNTHGKITARYYATLVPHWHGNEGTMVEKQWNDEGKLFFQQDWKIQLADNGHDFTATATKIDGVIHGQARGYAMHMAYTVRVPNKKGDETRLSAQDWTYLQPDGTGLNKVSLSKFGIHVGDITYILHPVAKGKKMHEGYFPHKK